MGWIAITKGFEILREETHGRPVQAGEEGNLLVIAQEDFGHRVAIDLVNGIVFVDYDDLSVQNGTVGIANDKMRFVICEETNIVGELAHVEQRLDWHRDESGKKVLDPETGRFLQVRSDILTPLTWRPIWFTRWTNGQPTKVIGAQTTLPKEYGGRNVKKMISLFGDGRLGID